MTQGPSLHQRANTLLTRIGSPVTFTFTQTTINELTGGTIASAFFVSGHAIPDTDDQPKVYQDLGLIIGKAVTLLFSPSAYGEVPQIGSTVVWGGTTYTVRFVSPHELDATAILVKVVISL